MLTYKFKPSILSEYFDLKVVEQCKSCKRYGQKATCPPYVSSMEYYQKLLPTYTHGRLLIKKYECKDHSQWKEIGKKSSVEMTKYLQEQREVKQKEGVYFVVAFGAGSCKLCTTCTIPCIHPSQSLVPIEATGINVFKLVKKVTGIELSFPVKECFYRVGMLLW